MSCFIRDDKCFQLSPVASAWYLSSSESRSAAETGSPHAFPLPRPRPLPRPFIPPPQGSPAGIPLLRPLKCLVLRQSVLNGDPKNLTGLEGGVPACRGSHSSFDTTSGGFSLNMGNQNIEGRRQIDLVKAKRMLKNLRIKTKHNNLERKILGLSELPCNQQREMLLDFYQSSNGKKPEQIVIFRDGVGQSQFNQVLNIEVDQIIKAYEMMGNGPLPKVTVIIAQKHHHTKLFQADNPQVNVPPDTYISLWTVVDMKIVHPRHYDFYVCTHNRIIGTSRPAHYNVLKNEIGFFFC